MRNIGLALSSPRFENVNFEYEREKGGREGIEILTYVRFLPLSIIIPLYGLQTSNEYRGDYLFQPRK